MACSYHVTYENSKKILNVNSPEKIYDEVTLVFGVSKFDLQSYAPEFDDWVDFDKCITTGRLKVVCQNNSNDILANTNSSPNSSMNSSATTVEYDGSEREDSIKCSTSDSSDDEHKIDSLKQKVWPVVYNIPAFPKTLSAELSTIENDKQLYVGGKTRRKIISIIFDDLCSYTE